MEPHYADHAKSASISQNISAKQVSWAKHFGVITQEQTDFVKQFSPKNGFFAKIPLMLGLILELFSPDWL